MCFIITPFLSIDCNKTYIGFELVPGRLALSLLCHGTPKYGLGNSENAQGRSTGIGVRQQSLVVWVWIRRVAPVRGVDLQVVENEKRRQLSAS